MSTRTNFSTRDEHGDNKKITAEDIAALRGMSGVMKMEDLQISVNVVEARLRFGHLDLLVTPVAGTGERWVETHRVALVPPGNVVTI
jgi:hypothetical protein